MTSYPDELVQRYEQAFERANPGTDLQVVLKPSRDAALDGTAGRPPGPTR
ncbi:hypothetical protein [Azospirillum sp. TSA6c]|nr:hypothetical protein [Azospirillum sp. TSA6c]